MASSVAPPSSQSSNPAASLRRRHPVGAECLGDGRTHFRVWAPGSRRVSVFVDDTREAPLDAEADGYFAGATTASAGARYQFQLYTGDRLYPDPASRFQPDGPRGWSEVIDPLTFQWTDTQWRGVALPGQVVYEMHVGTFTP